MHDPEEQELSAEESLSMALDEIATTGVGYRALECAILGQCVKDVRFPDEDAMQFALDAGFESLDAELEYFWDSDRCLMLRDMAGLELIGLEDLA